MVLPRVAKRKEKKVFDNPILRQQREAKAAKPKNFVREMQKTGAIRFQLPRTLARLTHLEVDRIHTLAQEWIEDAASQAPHSEKRVTSIFQQKPGTLSASGDGKRIQIDIFDILCATEVALEAQHDSASSSMSPSTSHSKESSFDLALMQKLASIRSEIQQYILNAWPDASISCTASSILFSKKGCQSQYIHCDSPVQDVQQFYDKSATTQVQACPLSVVFAIEGGTRLRIWPGGHHVLHGRRRSRPIRMKRLRIPQGYGVAFRQDFPHAGDSYLKANHVRLFLSFDLTWHPRQLDTTGVIAAHLEGVFLPE